MRLPLINLILSGLLLLARAAATDGSNSSLDSAADRSTRDFLSHRGKPHQFRKRVTTTCPCSASKSSSQPPSHSSTFSSSSPVTTNPGTLTTLSSSSKSGLSTSKGPVSLSSIQPPPTSVPFPSSSQSVTSRTVSGPLSSVQLPPFTSVTSSASITSNPTSPSLSSIQPPPTSLSSSKSSVISSSTPGNATSQPPTSAPSGPSASMTSANSSFSTTLGFYLHLGPIHIDPATAHIRSICLRSFLGPERYLFLVRHLCSAPALLSFELFAGFFDLFHFFHPAAATVERLRFGVFYGDHYLFCGIQQVFQRRVFHIFYFLYPAAATVQRLRAILFHIGHSFFLRDIQCLFQPRAFFNFRLFDPTVAAVQQLRLVIVHSFIRYNGWKRDLRASVFDSVSALQFRTFIRVQLSYWKFNVSAIYFLRVICVYKHRLFLLPSTSAHVVELLPAHFVFNPGVLFFEFGFFHPTAAAVQWLSAIFYSLIRYHLHHIQRIQLNYIFNSIICFPFHRLQHTCQLQHYYHRKLISDGTVELNRTRECVIWPRFQLRSNNIVDECGQHIVLSVFQYDYIASVFCGTDCQLDIDYFNDDDCRGRRKWRGRGRRWVQLVAAATSPTASSTTASAAASASASTPVGPRQYYFYIHHRDIYLHFFVLVLHFFVLVLVFIGLGLVFILFVFVFTIILLGIQEHLAKHDLCLVLFFQFDSSAVKFVLTLDFFFAFCYLVFYLCIAFWQWSHIYHDCHRVSVSLLRINIGFRDRSWDCPSCADWDPGTICLSHPCGSAPLHSRDFSLSIRSPTDPPSAKIKGEQIWADFSAATADKSPALTTDKFMASYPRRFSIDEDVSTSVTGQNANEIWALFNRVSVNGADLDHPLFPGLPTTLKRRATTTLLNYEVYLSPGVIIATLAYKDRDRVPKADQVNWDVIAMELYKQYRGAESPTDLRFIMQFHIDNKLTQDVLVELYTKSGMTADLEALNAGWTKWDANDGGCGTDAVLTLLGTVNGAGAGWMLFDYHTTLGGKRLANMYTRRQAGWWGMVIEFA
ncbi:hypothetical protein DFH09DRAFT_1369412 [Mycena vulgaris]|nr:hypothetical protein DFH09DRAFT_1369412 [Mycena vulgaris]